MIMGGVGGRQFTHILMFHVFQQAEFPVSSLGKELGLKGSVELLDRYLGTSALVKG